MFCSRVLLLDLHAVYMLALHCNSYRFTVQCHMERTVWPTTDCAGSAKSYGSKVVQLCFPSYVCGCTAKPWQISAIETETTDHRRRSTS
jgi:hypothetical protein